MIKRKLNSSLTISTVGALHKPMVETIAKLKGIELNLSEITSIDSAGIAFLLDLKSIAENKNCTLKFINIPDIVERFCSLYNVSL
jgi:ABC-type transporter Mla MlaB component